MSIGLSFYFTALTEFNRISAIEASRSRREVEDRLRSVPTLCIEPGPKIDFVCAVGDQDAVVEAGIAGVEPFQPVDGRESGLGVGKGRHRLHSIQFPLWARSPG